MVVNLALKVVFGLNTIYSQCELLDTIYLSRVRIKYYLSAWLLMLLMWIRKIYKPEVKHL